MTVKELKQRLAAIGTGYDAFEVEVWLPGSRIKLNGPALCHADVVLIEGNLTDDSALAQG